MAKLYHMHASEFGQDTLDFGEDGRPAFFNRNRELSGKELQSSMEAVAYHETSTERETSELVLSASAWLDQTDLTKKYEGKEDELAQVLANAKQMTHPLRKVTLYEDFEISTKQTLTQEQERERELKQTWEEEHKPKKIKKDHLYGTVPCSMPYRTVRAVVLYTVFYSVYYMLCCILCCTVYCTVRCSVHIYMYIL